MKRKVLIASLFMALVALASLTMGCGGSSSDGDGEDSLNSSNDNPGTASQGGVGSQRSDEPVMREEFGDDDSGSADFDESSDEALEEAPPATDGGGEGNNALGVGALDRKIIQTATIEVEVGDVLRSFSTISRLATQAGGFVAGSNVYSEDEQRFATITIRVPADRYTETLEEVRGLGEVVSEGSNASDVTEEYTDLQSRLRNLEAVEGQYAQLLGQATTINDILTVQDRLNQVRLEIEQIQGRLNVLDDLGELATIEVFLSPPLIVAEEKTTSDGWNAFAPAEAALENSLAAAKWLAAAGIAVGIYALWLIPVGVLALFVLRLQQRSRPPGGPGPTAGPTTEVGPI
ncbi:MAG: DUF4349 domain-containing protein [Dehalococcoidia bacterium]